MNEPVFEDLESVLVGQFVVIIQLAFVVRSVFKKLIKGRSRTIWTRVQIEDHSPQMSIRYNISVGAIAVRISFYFDPNSDLLDVDFIPIALISIIPRRHGVE